MKKIGILLLLVLFSCGKADIVSLPAAQAPIRFELSATHPGDTKAVKTGWDDGDVIFVFFNNIESPRYLRMSYNNGSWSYAEMNVYGNPEAGSLGLKNGDTGKITAVYFPFGSNASVYSQDGGDRAFYFSKTTYSYYLTATIEYKVADNTLSGQLEMKVPDGFVQFYVADTNTKADGKYKLGTDAVTPRYVKYIDRYGNVIEDTSDNMNMPGYVYGDGYLFSGKLKQSYDYPYTGNYYFAKTEWNGNSVAGRSDYFVKGKTIGSHDSILLPANNSENTWIPVGTNYSVNFGSTVGEWRTCNEGADYPQQFGGEYTFSQYYDSGNPSATKLPTSAQFTELAKLFVTDMTVYGMQGAVFQSGSKFIFLPVNQNTKVAYYWTSSLQGNEPYNAVLDLDPPISQAVLSVPGHTPTSGVYYSVRLLK